MSITVIIPTYNHATSIERTIHSILSQAPIGSPLYNQIAVIVCDDASTDATVEVVQRLALDDTRISLIASPLNQGTLLNRKQGVAAATTPWVMLMDADDELASGALEQLLHEAEVEPAQILHFGAKVIAENEAAHDAAFGMEYFLTPPARSLKDDAILQTQFAESNGFDWHVHHKLYDHKLLQKAYATAADIHLILSDDVYLCFIIDSLARSYRAIPQSQWYLYHLGAGNTFGNAMDLKHLKILAQVEAEAYKLIRDFVESAQAPSRSDWTERLHDARDRIIFHIMNEWYDNLPEKDKSAGIDLIISAWQPVDGLSAIAAELWRFIRDEAYGLWVTDDRETPQAQDQKDRIDALLTIIKTVEDCPAFNSSHNDRYNTMKSTAIGHLKDLEMWSEYVQESQESQNNSQGDASKSILPKTGNNSWLHKLTHAATKIIKPHQ